MSGGRRVLTAALVALLLPVAGATADVAGPDETIGQAFGPLVAGTLYSGGFTTGTDIDYLAFDVAEPGQTLHFDITNTVHGCASPDLTGCPVYATLIDGAGRQLGGEGSSAGTAPVSEYWNSDVIDWTFDAPGRYYVVVESDGDLPTYTLRYHVVPPHAIVPPGGTGGGQGTGGAGAGRPIALLRVSLRQHGTVVRVGLGIGRPLRSLTLSLSGAGARPGTRPVALERLGAVRPGKHTVTLRLGASARTKLAAHGRLAAWLRIVATPLVGAKQTVRRLVGIVP